MKDLHARKVNEDLVADVDIYAKAGKWLLEFPQGFGNPQGIATYLGVLDQGLARGRQLQQGHHRVPPQLRRYVRAARQLPS